MQDLISIEVMLAEQKPQVEYLINNAGIAQMKASKDFAACEIENTINLNCKAPAVLINYCLPYRNAVAGF